MGAAISVNRLCTTVLLSDEVLHINMNGNLKTPVIHKKIGITLNGKVINTADSTKKLTETVRKYFLNYIKSSDFKAFAQNHLLKKAESYSPGYKFSIMPHSFTNLSWSLENINVAETTEKPVFNIFIDCVLSTNDESLHFSSTVSHIGQNFIQTINNKRIPVFTINDKNYSFDINNVAFDLI